MKSEIPKIHNQSAGGQIQNLRQMETGSLEGNIIARENLNYIYNI